MAELVLIDLFIRYGFDRLLHSEWPLAAAILFVVLIRSAIVKRQPK